MKRAGILLFDGVEELDASGPWETLSHWCQAYPEDDWEVTCARRPSASSPQREARC